MLSVSQSCFFFVCFTQDCIDCISMQWGGQRRRKQSDFTQKNKLFLAANSTHHSNPFLGGRLFTIFWREKKDIFSLFFCIVLEDDMKTDWIGVVWTTAVVAWKLAVNIVWKNCAQFKNGKEEILGRTEVYHRNSILREAGRKPRRACSLPSSVAWSNYVGAWIWTEFNFSLMSQPDYSLCFCLWKPALSSSEGVM